MPSLYASLSLPRSVRAEPGHRRVRLVDRGAQEVVRQPAQVSEPLGLVEGIIGSGGDDLLAGFL
jgi:hypothetical protein